MKNKKQLQDANSFMEGLGDGIQGGDSAGSSSVKIENVTFVDEPAEGIPEAADLEYKQEKNVTVGVGVDVDVDVGVDIDMHMYRVDVDIDVGVDVDEVQMKMLM